MGKPIRARYNRRRNLRITKPAVEKGQFFDFFAQINAQYLTRIHKIHKTSFNFIRNVDLIYVSALTFREDCENDKKLEGNKDTEHH